MKPTDDEQLVIKTNRWDYISYSLGIYVSMIGPLTLVVYPPWFLSIVASTIWITLTIVVGELADKAERIRRKNLFFEPRLGFRDSLLKQMPILSQFWYLLVIPVLFVIPLTIVLFYFTNLTVFFFGLVLKLDLFSTYVKITYVLFLVLTVFPGYFIIKHRQFKSNHKKWMLANKTGQSSNTTKNI